MAAYQSIIAYDGTDFAGFQRQAMRRTVQGVLEQALRRLGWTERSLRAAGRTDTGVHARGQVIAFHLGWKRSSADLTAALNAHLPPEVSVKQTRPASDGFHPRYSALRRCYSYAVVAAPTRDPLVERFAWRVWPAPDAAAIQAACRLLVGEHDFRAFGPAPRKDGNTRRTVWRSEWQAVEAAWVYRIEGDAFLYRMVRRIVSALISVGRRELSAEALASLLDDPARRWQGSIAPAHGLCLEAVIYNESDGQSGGLGPAGPADPMQE
jgi:tRNA pseudouridine38-40 synthase